MTAPGPPRPYSTSAASIREHFHPLYHARRLAPMRVALGLADAPMWRRFEGIDWPVRVRFVRHAAYILGRRSPERVISELMRSLITIAPPRTFVDVGANFGYYGFLVNSLVPTSRVVLVEPEPDNIALLERTLARALRPNIELHPVALSDVTGAALLRRDRVSGATGSLERAEPSFATRNWGVSGTDLRVRTSTLDAVAANRDVDVVKIDVEGHEETVLSGGKLTLERCEPILFIECSHRDGRLEGLLAPYGYQLLDADRIAPVGEETENVLAWTSRRDVVVDQAREAALDALTN